MSNWNLEPKIKIKFCVKLGMSENETCALLSEACGAEAVMRSKC
jgi:hypothetical protein